MSEKRYLIVLQGQGDTSITLANETAEAWIDSGFDRSKGRHCYEERIPDAVLQGHTVEEDCKVVQVTSGSYDNDRALACPGMSFDSLKDVMKYIAENSIELCGEYHGYIY